MRKPIIFKDHCDDDLPWTCCYEDEESNVEWSEGRFYIGFGKTAIAAYVDWKNKKGLEELKEWNQYEDYQKLQASLQTILKSDDWFMTADVGIPVRHLERVKGDEFTKLDVESVFILDAQTATDMLENPPEPNEKLIELLRMK